MSSGVARTTVGPTVPVVAFTVAGYAANASAGLGRPYTVVWDGNCKVCRRLSALLEKWDRKGQMEIVPSQAPGVMARFPWIPAKAYAEALQMVGPGGETWSGAAAIEQILNVVPKGRFLSWVFTIPYVRVIADRFYKWFARNRYRMGCGDHCASRPIETLFEP